jgi:hypothetical protein
MPRTLSHPVPPDNPFSLYRSSRFTRGKKISRRRRAFLNEASEEYSQNQTSLSNRRKKTRFIPTKLASRALGDDFHAAVREAAGKLRLTCTAGDKI